MLNSQIVIKLNLSIGKGIFFTINIELLPKLIDYLLNYDRENNCKNRR